MGAGTNCSYTNSTSRVFIQLLCSTPACCDTTLHACSTSACSSSESSSEVPLNTYLFWVILACAAIFTVFVLFVSYVICRYRKPGCADAGAARDRFLEENILPATLSRWPGTHHHASSSSSPSTSQASADTPSSLSSPPAGQSPSSSPDPLLLVHRPLNKARAGKSMIPVKKPTAAAVNKAFIMGAEAFARKPIVVRRREDPPANPVQRLQWNNDLSGPSSGTASPRMVQLGGFTPRVNFRDKGRTESKQTIISSDTDSMTTVGS